MKKVLYLFSGLSDSDVDWLGARGKVVVKKSGERLIAEGEDNDALFIVLSGSLDVSTRAAGVVSRVAEGEILGEMSLVDGRDASATVMSVGESKLLRVPRVMMEQQLDRDIGFSARFFRGIAITLSERLRDREAKLGNMVVDELSSRLLEHVHLAGARFDRLLKASMGHA